MAPAEAGEAESAVPQDEVLDLLQRLTIEKPLMSETVVRQDLLEEHGVQLTAEQVRRLLARLAEAGAVDLAKEAYGGITVRPSLRALREAAARPGAQGRKAGQRPGSGVCKEMAPPRLPHHLREGNHFALVVTEVKNPDHFWFNVYDDSEDADPANPTHFEAVEKVMDEMEEFYTGTEGDAWAVSSVSLCPAGTVLAGLYKREGFHRVLVKEVVDLTHLKLFYMDHGTTAVQKLKHVRWLKHEFGLLPSQALAARVWGLEPAGASSRWRPEARARLVELARAEPGAVLGQIVAGVGRRDTRPDSTFQLPVDRGLSLRLHNVNLGRRGTDLGSALVAEGLARWEDQGPGPGPALPRAEGPEEPAGSLATRQQASLGRLARLCRQLGMEGEAAQAEAACLGP
jgi:hypothetical protein